MEEWSNQAVLGYVIKGLEELGKSEKEIEEIVKAVRSRFDWISVEEAAEIYRSSPY